MLTGTSHQEVYAREKLATFSYVFIVIIRELNWPCIGNTSIVDFVVM